MGQLARSPARPGRAQPYPAHAAHPACQLSACRCAICQPQKALPLPLLPTSRPPSELVPEQKVAGQAHFTRTTSLVTKAGCSMGTGDGEVAMRPTWHEPVTTAAREGPPFIH